MLMISPYEFFGIYRESDLAPKAQGKKPIRRKQANLRRIWIIIPIHPQKNGKDRAVSSHLDP